MFVIWNVNRVELMKIRRLRKGFDRVNCGGYYWNYLMEGITWKELEMNRNVFTSFRFLFHTLLYHRISNCQDGWG